MATATTWRRVVVALASGPLLLALHSAAGAATAPPAKEAAARPPEGLWVIPRGGEAEVAAFGSDAIEPKHAVAIGVAGKGTKRHKLLKELASDEQLAELLEMGVQFNKSGSSLTMFRYRYDPEVYAGKWVLSEVRAWLLDMAFPPVNRIKYEVASRKYLTKNPFGAVVIVKPMENQTEDLVKALEPYAAKYRHLKFTFFPYSPLTESLCKTYGIWTTDELLLLETTKQIPLNTHGNTLQEPKYRLEGVTPASIDDFFGRYAAGTLPRYHLTEEPRPEGPPMVEGGIRVLTGWDFDEVVLDPLRAVLVVFESGNCAPCKELRPAFHQAVHRLQDAHRRDADAFVNLTAARIDTSKNEHSHPLKGTPMIYFWPLAMPRTAMLVDARTAETIVKYIEAVYNVNLEKEVWEEEEEAPAAATRKAKLAKKTVAKRDDEYVPTRAQLDKDLHGEL